MLELMAPAGDKLSFLAAIENGADSIYLGLKKFNARKPAAHFSISELKKAINFAHSLEKKIYLTLNIDVKANEIKDVAEILSIAVKYKVDAVIVKDFGIINLINKFYNTLKIHLSTQCAISSSIGVRYATDMGVERVVLAREIELGEIKEICNGTSTECEIFTEGSMCFSISGRCYMSSWVGGKSGNRGMCTAPCRVAWDSSGKKGNYFSMKDLRLITYIKEIQDVGVKAVKIEGRLKRAPWVGNIVGFYRKAIDKIDVPNSSIDEQSILKELSKFSAREVAEGHLNSHGNLTGKNEEWQDYEKNIPFVPKDDPFTCDNKIEFEFTHETITTTLIVDEQSLSFEVQLRTQSKKAKLVSFQRIINELSDIRIANQKFEIIIRDGDIPFAPSAQLKKIKKQITDSIIKLTTLQNASSQLEEPVLDYIKFSPIPMKRKKLLGNLPNKVIINSSQISNFLSSNFNLDEVTVSLDLNTDISELHRIGEQYNIVISIPQILYNDSSKQVYELIKKIKNSFNIFEANSYTGLEIIKNITDCKKRVGVGLAVLNHSAANYFYERGFESVYISFEADEKDYKLLSEFANGQIEALIFSKLPLFVSRVQSGDFSNNSLFADKFGVKIKCIKKNDVNWFASEDEFNMLGSQLKSKNIFFNKLSADLRFFSSPSSILQKIMAGEYNGKGNNFNFFRKLQ